MSDDLTRDEIRSACEAVPGWEWNERQKPPGEELDWNHFDFAREVWEHPGGERVVIARFHPTSRTPNEDALALLEATGEEYQINRQRDPWDIKEWGEFEVVLSDFARGGPDLKTAAVRAVNQWAENRKETP